jgi:translocator protein
MTCHSSNNSFEFAWGLSLIILYPSLMAIINGIVQRFTADEWAGWYESLERSPLSPLPHAFGIVWPLLYLLMALTGALLFLAGSCESSLQRVAFAALAFHVAQLFLNAIWAPLFFQARFTLSALAVCACTTAFCMVAMALSFFVRIYVGVLYMPYVAWMLFATYLNWYVVEHNAHEYDKHGGVNKYFASAHDSIRQRVGALTTHGVPSAFVSNDSLATAADSQTNNSNNNSLMIDTSFP